MEAKPQDRAWTWARARAREHRGRFLVGGALFGVVLAAVNGYSRFALPADPDETDYALYGVVTILTAVGLIMLLTFLWALARAPYEQRDKLLKESKGQSGPIDIDVQCEQARQVIKLRITNNSDLAEFSVQVIGVTGAEPANQTWPLCSWEPVTGYPERKELLTGQPVLLQLADLNANTLQNGDPDYWRFASGQVPVWLSGDQIVLKVRIHRVAPADFRDVRVEVGITGTVPTCRVLP